MKIENINKHSFGPWNRACIPFVSSIFDTDTATLAYNTDHNIIYNDIFNSFPNATNVQILPISEDTLNCRHFGVTANEKSKKIVEEFNDTIPNCDNRMLYDGLTNYMSRNATGKEIFGISLNRIDNGHEYSEKTINLRASIICGNMNPKIIIGWTPENILGGVTWKTINSVMKNIIFTNIYGPIYSIDPTFTKLHSIELSSICSQERGVFKDYFKNKNIPSQNSEWYGMYSLPLTQKNVHTVFKIINGGGLPLVLSNEQNNEYIAQYNSMYTTEEDKAKLDSIKAEIRNQLIIDPTETSANIYCKYHNCANLLPEVKASLEAEIANKKILCDSLFPDIDQLVEAKNFDFAKSLLIENNISIEDYNKHRKSKGLPEAFVTTVATTTATTVVTNTENTQNA